jgi:putative endonuclease
MFYAYVIKSRVADFVYKGHCENLEERMKQHNSGMTESIRPYVPFDLIYSEEFDLREEAIIREKYFKSAAGRRFLKGKLRGRVP